MNKRRRLPPHDIYRIAAEGLAFYAKVFAHLDPQTLAETLRAEPSGDRDQIKRLGLILYGAANPEAVAAAASPYPLISQA